MDAQGAEVVRRFTEGAGATFTTTVDRAQGLWELYGFDVVPNGFFVDERGVLRYLKIGGFDARDAEDVGAIEALLARPASGEAEASAAPAKFRTVADALREAGDAAKRDPDNLDRLLTLAERRVEAREYAAARRDFEAALAKQQSARALVGLAAVYLDLGERAKALEALRQARALQPDNWIIRKQIWAVEHPEEFYPAIHTDWQKKRIEQEDAGRK